MPLDPQKILLGKIEGLKIANEAFSSHSFFSNFPSLFTANPINFLTDFFKLLFGAEKIKSDLIRFLVVELNDLMSQLLQFYKSKIVEYYYCNLDKIIPDIFFTEQEFEVKKIDFFGILKIDPNSDFGKYFYQDYQVNLDKKLHESIQNPNTVINWQQILNIRFNNDKFYVKLDDSLQGKTINTFVNRYLGNIQLHNQITIISDLIDAIFGTLTSLLPLSKSNIQDRLKFDVLVENILNSLEFSDNFYVFDEEEIANSASEKLKGYYKYIDCNVNYTEYDINLFSQFIDDLNNSELNEITYTLNLNYLINKTSVDVDDVDKSTYSNNLFLTFFRYLTKSISLSLFAPKRVLFVKLFAKMANKDISGLNMVDFFKENQNFILDIIKNKIQDFILKYLLSIIIKELSEILQQSNLKKQQEQLKNYKLQIQSLAGLNNIF